MNTNEAATLRTIYSLPESSGKWVLYIPVDDNPQPQYAIVDGDIWHELIGLGLYPRLRLEDGKVMAWFPKQKKYYPFRHLVVDGNKEDNIYPKDGNQLNLRQDNIVIDRRPTLRYRDLLDPAFGRAGMLVRYEFGNFNKQ